MNIEAGFVISAAGASDFPQDGLSQIALVGRSNVGKSSLINALTRQRVARTSAAPGKTRLANIYRVARGTAEPFYLVDLPGFGYARGDARELEAVTRAFFGQNRLEGRDGQGRQVSALLLVDSRHPGLQSDTEAWQWLERTVERCAIVATKIDKLAHGERIRALRELESVFENSVLPVSAVTAEGLDELWTLIDRLRHRSRPLPGRRRNPEATDRPPRPRRKS